MFGKKSNYKFDYKLHIFYQTITTMIIQTDVLWGIFALTILMVMLISPFFYERDWEDEMEQRRYRSAKR
jgi:hypothetical protein